MYANLKPGGRLVLEMGGKGNVGSIVKQIKIELQKRGYRSAAAIEPWYFPSIGEYASELERVGFRVTQAQHYDRPTQLSDQQTGFRTGSGIPDTRTGLSPIRLIWPRLRSID